MKRNILDSRRKVVQAIIGAYPGGRECAATRLGLDLKKFDNHAYESAGSRPLTDEQLHVLEQDANTTYLPEYLAQLYNGMFVPL
ncbi:YmfL family putative regulatory protein, partial [Pseudomonas citronellolis]